MLGRLTGLFPQEQLRSKFMENSGDRPKVSRIKEAISKFLDKQFPGRIKPNTRFDILDPVKDA